MLNKKTQGFETEKLIVLPPYQLEEMTSHPIIRQAFVTDIGYFHRAKHHYRERPKGCDSYIFIYCTNGEGWIKLGSEETIHVTEKTVSIIPAFTPHSYGAKTTNPWSIYWFHFRGEELVQLLESLSLEAALLHVSLPEAEKIVELFNQCYELLSAKSYSVIHQLHISQTIRYLLSYISLIPRRKQDEKMLAYIEQAIQYMKDQLEGHLTLEDLVTRTRISKQHLNHLFKQSTGYAPIDYYLRLKMQRAGQLFDLTDQSVKAVSLSLGFKDPYYFSRLFKKIIGVSPTDYRRQLKG
ncbi:AraC family transcriptional regulator [Paenibacillus algorifonticola]|uniref:helix-turn-helix domain-containing protein n=1 Tax=Paenibacillus algorifonticola TaxID=684063 RepID=UPI003D29D75B